MSTDGLWKEQAGQDFASRPFNHMSESRGIQRWFRPNVDGTRAMHAGPVNKVGGRVDGAGRTHDDH